MTDLTRVIAGICVSLALAGCALLPFETPIPGGPQAAEIAAHQRAWQQQGIRSYTWQVSFLCECLLSGPTTITVVDGVATGASNPAGPIRMQDAGAFPSTVDALYAEALRTLAAGGTVRATWDASGVLPRTVFLDRDPQAIDDELSVSVDRLDPAS